MPPVHPVLLPTNLAILLGLLLCVAAGLAYWRVPHWRGRTSRLRGRALELEDLNQRLQHEIEARTASEARLQLLTDAIPQIVWTADVHGNRMFLNRRWVEYTGLQSHQGTGAAWAVPIHPDDREGVIQAWDRAVRTGEPFTYEYRLLRAEDQTYRWQLVRALAHRDATGQVLGWYGSTTDIHDRRQAEDEVRELRANLAQRVAERTRELQQMNAELAAANQELEAFTYSVSHDLRAPLRHIHGFVEMLRQRLGDRLDPESARLVHKVSESARHLGQLVDDLLDFARTGRQELAPRSVSMRALVDEVRQLLAPDLVDREIDWRIGPLPSVHGDESMLRQVWWNLLSNAVKYTRPRDRAVIEVQARIDGGFALFTVHDNGVGFESQYAHKLFGVFQRLHRAEEFEGTGIGLAHVRRIVQRHGGETWAEGKPNEGAIFRFSLPSPGPQG